MSIQEAIEFLRTKGFRIKKHGVNYRVSTTGSRSVLGASELIEIAGCINY